MHATPSSISGDKVTPALLLLAILLFSWLTTVKNSVGEWLGIEAREATPTKPNILLIVADDLGYDDSTIINSTGLDTPNLRQLADHGTTFRRHYADSTCTPSRVAILTGREPERSGFRPVGGEIPQEFATLAEVLSTAGYRTYLTGKWHAGEDRVSAWPQNKGFSNWFGFLNQWELSGEITEASKGVRKPTYNNPMLRSNGGELSKHDGHLTDILTEHSVGKIRELSRGDQPWFLYHAFLAPHQPIQPHDRYRQRYPNTPEGAYHALVNQLDDAIGKLVATVDRENTLIIFLSDNGGTNAERNNNFPFFGKKGDPYEGAFRTPLIVSWPGVVPQGKVVDDIVMNTDIYPTLLASAQVPPVPGIDGQNLWPLILNDIALMARPRSWEVYFPSINSMGYSFLSANGNWRMASLEGLLPSLHPVSIDASGETDLQEGHPQKVKELTAAFWQEQVRKSRVEVTESIDGELGRRSYSGFDAMRTPYRYGFAIGLEIGPLTGELPATPGGHVVAQQEGAWTLRYMPGQGLEWQLGETRLRDEHFDPGACNALVFTGYMRPRAHLSRREPKSIVKLYSGGQLRDAERSPEVRPLGDEVLANPTVVNFSGRALFSNTVLSTFHDPYEPGFDPKHLDIYKPLYELHTLSMAQVGDMTAQLCRDSSPPGGGPMPL